MNDAKIIKCTAWIEAPMNSGLLFVCRCPGCDEQVVIGMTKSEPYHCKKCECDFTLVGTADEAGERYDRSRN